jgi:hypothetical protein
MILRRINEHVRAQNWTAVVLDFLIVVVGVFIGIQVSNWNDLRAARVSEMEFLLTIRDDINQDIIDNQGFLRMLSDVSRYGNQALESLERNTACASNCWKELIDYFHASQWIDVRTNNATFDEIKRTGLPSDPFLKDTLTRYYGLTDQLTVINAELPRYRELIRSIIPASIQDHVWTQCLGIDGRQQILIGDCISPVSDDEARTVVEGIRSNAETKPSLTYWLSTTSIVTRALREQIEEAESVVAALDERIDGP